ncbi:MAG: HAD-IA family hydrolase [Candidatus Omnitrophica bacterium]|nr:HAD-IA family hydrolase [Candidatus Omnitrophota bacterium]MBU4457690.1 HAD-IA family hydrolase [Candidatus Omnitrophota bacterium]
MNYHKIPKSISLIILSIFISTNTIYGAAGSTLRVPLSSDSDLIEELNSHEKVEGLMAYLAGEELPELEKRYFGDELSIMKDMIDEFVEKEIKPHVSEWERKGSRKEGDKVVTEALENILGELAKLSVLGASTPEEYGGAGFSHYYTYTILKILSYAWPSLGVTVGVNASVQDAINKFGKEEQKKRFLPGLASKGLGAIAITEPGAGSDVMKMRTFARKEGKHYILDTEDESTSKLFITSAGIADWYLVFAVTDKGEDGRKKRISAFLVDKGTPGFSIGKIEEKIGQHDSPTGELIFDHCEIPEENMLGEPGQGMQILFYMLTGGRIGIASLALGIAKAAYHAASKYAEKRVQFNKPIGEFQEIKDMLTNMKFYIDTSELLIRYASYLKDQDPDSSEDRNGMVTVASIAKLYASEKGDRVARDAIQIHGAYGYSKEYPVSRHLEDIVVATIYEGTSQIQKDIIQRYISLLLNSEIDVEKLIDSYLKIHPTIAGKGTMMEAVYRAMDSAKEKLGDAVDEERVTYREADLLTQLVVTRLMFFKAIFIAHQNNVPEETVAKGLENALLASRFLRDSIAEYENYTRIGGLRDKLNILYSIQTIRQKDFIQDQESIDLLQRYLNSDDEEIKAAAAKTIIEKLSLWTEEAEALRLDAMRVIEPYVINVSGTQPVPKDVVILDWDGTVANTIDNFTTPYYMKLYRMVTEGLAPDIAEELEITEHDIATVVGFLQKHSKPSLADEVSEMKNIAIAKGVERKVLLQEEEYKNIYFGWREKFVKGLTGKNKKAWLMPGAEELLKALEKAGKKVYILSNASREVVRKEAKLSGILRYINGIFDTENISKPSSGNGKTGVIKYILDIEKIDASRVLVIGDTPGDIDAARQAGVDSLGIANNNLNAVKALIKTGATFVATSLRPTKEIARAIGILEGLNEVDLELLRQAQQAL